jgi:hypothetical protein
LVRGLQPLIIGLLLLAEAVLLGLGLVVPVLVLEVELQLGGGYLASLHLQELGCGLLLPLGGV